MSEVKLPLIVPEEHDRSKLLGSSDIPALLGRCPPSWSRNSPVSLYHDKTTPKTESASSSRGVLKRGKLWEQVVGEMLIASLEEQGWHVEIVSTNHRYRDPEIPYFAAEIDMEIRLNDAPDIVNVELKTVHPFKQREWGESGSDGVPDWYLLQAYWAMGVTRRRRGIVAPLFGADELRAFVLDYDESFVQGIRERGQLFWERHVLPQVPPDPISCLDLEILFPEEKKDSVLVADDSVLEMLLEYRSLDSQISAHTHRAELLEFRIKQAMAQHEAIRREGSDKNLCTWKSRRTPYLDAQGLKEKYPKVHGEFWHDDRKSRAFRVNQEI